MTKVQAGDVYIPGCNFSINVSFNKNKEIIKIKIQLIVLNQLIRHSFVGFNANCKKLTYILVLTFGDQ